MTEVRFTDGRRVDVVDADCEFRPCFQFGLDRGPFVRGVGYRPARGHVDRPVCNMRHLHGCPHVGVHLTCSDCRAQLALVPEGDPRPDMPEACPRCGSADLYWLADVLESPRPCCDAPKVRKAPGTYTQVCQSCGTRLRGARLEIARAASA